MLEFITLEMLLVGIVYLQTYVERPKSKCSDRDST